jgi:hypothetical protein
LRLALILDKAEPPPSVRGRGSHLSCLSAQNVIRCSLFNQNLSDQRHIALRDV